MGFPNLVCPCLSPRPTLKVFQLWRPTTRIITDPLFTRCLESLLRRMYLTISGFLRNPSICHTSSIYHFSVLAVVRVHIASARLDNLRHRRQVVQLRAADRA